MDLGLDGRVYIVTGGTQGLGRATAEALVTDGARVLVSSRSQQSVDDAVAALDAIAISAEAVRGMAADNAAEDSPQRLVDLALDTWGRLDGVLVSVGGPPGTAALQASDDQWRAAFESVFLGAVRMARTVAPHLGAGGVIGLVLSTSVKTPLAGLEISNGLRPGLAMWSKQLADELGPRGVRVVGLLPGRVLTGRIRQLTPDESDRDRMAQAIPLRRLGDPAEFGRVAAFLLSPAASYVTGTVLAVDGGGLPSL